MIDSPVYPDELEALPGVLEQAGFPVSGLLATHGDWDHLLGRDAFPGRRSGAARSTAHGWPPSRAPRSASCASSTRSTTSTGRRPLSLAGDPVAARPGQARARADEHELELHPAEGHTADGIAYLMPWLGVLVCGDYLSPGRDPVDLRRRLGRRRTSPRWSGCEPLVERAETVVPGHGGPIEARRGARGCSSEDVGVPATALADARRRAAPLPPRGPAGTRRRSGAIHAENVAAATAASAATA